MDWCPSQDVHLLHFQCSWDKLWIHCDPKQENLITEEELAEDWHLKCMLFRVFWEYTIKNRNIFVFQLSYS